MLCSYAGDFLPTGKCRWKEAEERGVEREGKQPEERVVKLERESETLWELEPMTGLQCL